MTEFYIPVDVLNGCQANAFDKLLYWIYKRPTGWLDLTSQILF